ncbi:MAG: septal ring lytic transglycosylase RlpA family protein [Candidatus Obscuribacter sp.]|nr:septal ring lytic transglycosylase RlpA family protein [Candidatus Obscuribacter sp.]
MAKNSLPNLILTAILSAGCLAVPPCFAQIEQIEASAMEAEALDDKESGRDAASLETQFSLVEAGPVVVEEAGSTSSKAKTTAKTAPKPLPVPTSAAKPAAAAATTASKATGKVDFTGLADYYHHSLYGKKTASGKILHKEHMTAAHRTLPFGTRVRVTNKRNGASCVVVINDRGPFTKSKVIDLSHAAASHLGILQVGTAQVACTVVENESKEE